MKHKVRVPWNIIIGQLTVCLQSVWPWTWKPKNDFLVLGRPEVDFLRRKLEEDDNQNSQIQSETSSICYANIRSVSFWKLELISSVLYKISDSRVKQLPLMDTPIPTAAFIIAYLAWVVVIGPLFMRDRKPFSLRNTLIYYNAFQVILSAYMFYEVVISYNLHLVSFDFIFKFRSIDLLAFDVWLAERIQFYVRNSRLFRWATVETGKKKPVYVYNRYFISSNWIMSFLLIDSHRLYIKWIGMSQKRN